MQRRTLLTLGIVLLLTVLTTGGAVLASSSEISRHVIAGGGGHVEAGVYGLDGTIGQPVTGVVSAGSYDLCSGFWCGTRAHKVYLPLVLRDA